MSVNHRISVNVDDQDMELLREVAVATADSRSRKALLQAVAESLARVSSVRRLVLVAPPGQRVTAELAQDRWHIATAAGRSTGRACPDASRVIHAAHQTTLLLPLTADRSDEQRHSRRDPAGLLEVILAESPPDFLVRPSFLRTLGTLIAVGVRHQSLVQRVADLSRRAYAENRDLRADLHRLEDSGAVIARSSAMQKALGKAALVARYSTAVLITGESGSGKQVLATEVHRRSARGHRPFVQVNCGAIPESLVESELFGHERGAFTGADRRHIGMFERAHRGSLLLDEVGELPLAAQVKLLRVLQESKIRRVGGESDIDVDVRVIAATHRPLAEMVRSGSFRQDLFYRLHVFPIAIPPLRDRPEDLPALAAALVEQLADKLRCPRPAIAPSVIARLRAYHWPGNVRELANILEAALIISDGGSLVLPDDFPTRRVAEPLAAVGPEGTPETFEQATRRCIESALRTSGGKIYGTGGAAEILGLKPGTLQSKMRKLDINRRDFVA